MPISGLVLLSSELPRELRTPARAHELREIPEVYGKALIGWETLPERLLRDDRDLTLADVLRIGHLLGQKPHEAGAARRQMLAGVPIDKRGLADVPRLVVGGRSRPDGHPRRLRAAGGLAWGRLRALRGPLALRAGGRREQLPAGGRRHPRVPRGEPPVAPAPAGPRRVRWWTVPRPRWYHADRPGGHPPAPTGPHSSRGPGHRPLKAEITGSNPVCGTKIPPAAACFALAHLRG